MVNKVSLDSCFTFNQLVDMTAVVGLYKNSILDGDFTSDYKQMRIAELDSLLKTVQRACYEFYHGTVLEERV